METLAIIGVRILEVTFAVGLAGSVIVVLITSVEDVKTLMESDRSPSSEREEQ